MESIAAESMMSESVPVPDMLSRKLEYPEEPAALPASIPKDWTAAIPTSTAGIHILDITLLIRTDKGRYKFLIFKIHGFKDGIQDGIQDGKG